ncbi:unnamed protein product [Pleuronectes platessa]|uniref:Uncharacterized protein n=1 Tax=Pleuronectes platessa TaxID=8262 RepID=A0A9N7ZD76_PLEPL|nr:unnamed protein product [Pleuronectes platessa]
MFQRRFSPVPCSPGPGSHSPYSPVPPPRSLPPGPRSLPPGPRSLPPGPRTHPLPHDEPQRLQVPPVPPPWSPVHALCPRSLLPGPRPPDSPSPHDEPQRLQVPVVRGPQSRSHPVLVRRVQLLPGRLLQDVQVAVAGRPVVPVVHGGAPRPRARQPGSLWGRLHGGSWRFLPGIWGSLSRRRCVLSGLSLLLEGGGWSGWLLGDEAC